MVDILNVKLTTMMDACYPEKTHRVKSTNKPWMTLYVLGEIEKRKEIYREEERSARWKRAKKETTRIIEKSKKEYVERVVEETKNNNNVSAYYKLVRTTSMDCSVPVSE